jgi:hypothetical protein
MIMIEQPEIATDLVRTTVTGLAEQRLDRWWSTRAHHGKTCAR